MQEQRQRFRLIVDILCVGIAAATFFLWRRDEALVKEVRQEVANLRAELAARQNTTSEAPSELQQTETSPELARRLDELFDSANQKVEQLRTAWNVPDEAARMDGSVDLDTATLKAYSPYFKARRERDEVQRLLSVLKLKTEVEKIDLGVEREKKLSQ